MTGHVLSRANRRSGRDALELIKEVLYQGEWFVKPYRTNLAADAVEYLGVARAGCLVIKKDASVPYWILATYCENPPLSWAWLLSSNRAVRKERRPEIELIFAQDLEARL